MVSPSLRVAMMAAVAVVVLAVTGCGGSSDEQQAAPVPAMCSAMDEALAVWSTSAPERVLGDPEELADFAGALQVTFNDALTTVAAEAPPDVDADIAVLRMSLADLYATAIRYVAGDMEAVPVQSPEALDALGRLKDWARPQCPGASW